MSASKNLGKVFMTPKGIWDKNSNYTKLDIVTNKVGKISCGYIATTDIEKNIEITDNRWLKLFELLDGDLTEEYKAVQTDVTNKATAVNTNKKAVDLIYSQMQKLYDVEISTTTPTNERTGLWINPDDISGVINIPEIKDDEVSDVDTWSSKKIDNVTNSLKEDLSTKITKFYASSQGETHLADSDNGKITDMVLYGRSEQKQYSGKNLVKATLESTTKNGITCTNNGDGTYTLNGTANGGDDTTVSFNVGHMIAKSGKYIVVGCPKGGNSEKYNLRIGKDNIPWGTYVNSDLGNGCLINVTDNTPITLNLMIKDGYTCNNVIFKPMIVDASLYPDTAYDDFEPYTGGIPSPSPDYPQEIKSVVNPTVKVCGKNLLNYKETIINGPDVAGIEFVENGFRIYTKKDVNYCSSKTYLDFSKLRIGETYTLSANLLIVKGVSRLTIRNRVNTIIADSSNITESGTYKISFTLTDQMYYVSFFATFDAAVSGDVIVTDIQLEKNATPTAFEPYHEQTVTLPYTLNAIPVNSGGNVTIDGQQYVADYVDVERGKVVKRVKVLNISNLDKSKWGFRTDTSGVIWHSTRYYGTSSMLDFDTNINAMSNIAIYGGIGHDAQGTFRLVDAKTYLYQFNLDKTKFDKVQDFTDYLASNNVYIQYALKVPQELDLKPEEIVLFKSLSANYPTTNISINSEQLDGYTVFNYPISMQNGWNYVKQQIGDTREYIYDMDARAQDTDLQAAEAYVNSEYAVALTELEV